MRRLRWALLVALVVAAQASPARADFFQVTYLISNDPTLTPGNTDASLQNPWGVSFGGGGPFWVSNQMTGNSTLYNAAGVKQGLTVVIPPAGGTGSPTGQVNNSTANDFLIGGGKPAFIFDTLNGTLAGWVPAAGNTALLAPIPTQPSGSSFTGLTLINNGTSNLLLAANDGLGRVDVFDTNYANPAAYNGKFSDPTLPAGYTPYNIRALGSTVYVAYENSNGTGGVLDKYDLNGNLIARLVTDTAGTHLSHPWGLALAPTGFGQFGGALLVGNEGDGNINAYNPDNGTFLGTLQLFDSHHNPLNIGFGLWALVFGNTGSNGDPNTLFFSDGINGEAGGAFGMIRSVPELGTMSLCAIGGALFYGYRRRKAARLSRATA
jgi:uncharacterized protein (TIGR03118 family)